MAGVGGQSSGNKGKGVKKTGIAKTKPRTYRLPIDLIEWLEKHSANASEYVRQALIEKRAREDSTDRDILIVVKAKERTTIQNEIAGLESDPPFVKARQRLKAVGKPNFFKVPKSLGGGQIIPASTRKEAGYFLLAGERLDIDEYDSLLKERAVNKKIVEGYEATLTALRAKLAKLDSELSSLSTV